MIARLRADFDIAVGFLIEGFEDAAGAVRAQDDVTDGVVVVIRIRPVCSALFADAEDVADNSGGDCEDALPVPIPRADFLLLSNHRQAVVIIKCGRGSHCSHKPPPQRVIHITG